MIDDLLLASPAPDRYRFSWDNLISAPRNGWLTRMSQSTPDGSSLAMPYTLDMKRDSGETLSGTRCVHERILYKTGVRNL